MRLRFKKPLEAGRDQLQEEEKQAVHWINYLIIGRVILAFAVSLFLCFSGEKKTLKYLKSTSQMIASRADSRSVDLPTAPDRLHYV